MLELLFALVTAAAADEPRAFVRGLVGASYDSDILIAPDSMFDQGRPSGYADSRLVTTGDASYWFVAEDRHHLGLVGAAALTNTAQSTHAAGDPYRLALSIPFLLDFDGYHPYRVLIRPTYQTLLMDPTLTSTKMDVQDSVIVDVEGAWRQTARFETALTLEYRRDKSHLLSSVGNYDADANKLTVRARETFTPAAGRALSLDLGLIQNAAAGKFIRYQRVEGSLGYAGPFLGPSTFSLSAGAYRLNFPTPDVPRRDLNLNAQFKARLPLDTHWAVELDASYARNAGLFEPYSYTRTVIMLAVTVAAGL